MTLDDITTKFKKKSWLRLCTLNNIDKWNLIDYLNEPIYASRYYIKTELQLTTRSCFGCGKMLSLGIFFGAFTARLSCNCSKNHTLTLADKLGFVFTKDQVVLIITTANKERKKGLPNTIDFWLARGFSVEESKNKVSETQKNRSSRSPAAKKNAQGYSQRTAAYWMKKGFAPEEAANKVSEIQVTNGLEYYTKKYGAAGKQLYADRIARWLNADGNKKMTANRSKKSIKLFESLGVGYFGTNEKTVQGKQKAHRVDFLYGDKIIEYYGDYWHGNPNRYAETDKIRKKKVLDVWAHDAKKVADLKDSGYKVLIVWEQEYVTDPENTIKKCKDFIK